LNGAKLFFMIRFLLVLAAVAASTSVYSQKVKLINAAEVVESGKQLYDSGKYSLAIEKYLTVPKRDTGYVYMLTELALAYIAAEQFDKALAACVEGLSKPSQYRAHLMKSQAIAVDRKGDYERSVVLFKKAIESFPFDHSLYFNLGITHYNHKEHEKAIDCFFKAISINPFHAGSHLNLARISAGQGKKTHAMLSFGIYLSINNEDNDRLILLDNVLSNQFKEDGTIPFNGVNAFDKLDQIIRAGIAMDKNYKTAINFDVATVRQFQMLFDQLGTIDTGASNDPWNVFYMPLFQTIKQNDMIDAFICHIVKSADNEQVNKWQKKNEKKTKAFYEVANAAISKNREKQNAVAQGFTAPVSAYFDASHRLDAIGEKDAQGLNQGKWIYYENNGEKAAEGVFEKGKKTGTWTYYKNDGSISSVENYNTGEVRVFNEGVNTQFFYLKEDKINGDVELFNACGTLREKLVYAGGKRNGAGKILFGSGKVKQTYNYENNNASGEFVNYYETGKVESRILYKNDKPEGPYLEYYPNGKLKAVGQYKDGALSGVWKYYHANGRLERTGSYVNGKATGDWMYYDRRGNNSEKRIFKEGNYDGDNTVYHEGKVYYVNTYKNDVLIKSTYLDANGKVTSSAGNTSGTFSNKGHYPGGQLASEGKYKKGKFDGGWTYYYPEGSKRSEFVYVEGEAEGAIFEYFRTGAKKFDSHYKGGQLHGYFIEYYEHGQIKQEGWFVEGQRQQQWLNYYPNGVLESDYYYMNDLLFGECYDYNTEGKLMLASDYKDGSLLSIRDFDNGGKDIMKSSKKGTELAFETNYRNGKPRTKYLTQCGDYTKVTKWFPSGKVYYSYDFLSGRKEGRYVQNAINGQVAREGSFLNNLEEGVWSSYYDNGALDSRGSYLMGDYDSTWTYRYENGQTSSVVEYLNDERHGITRIYSPDGKPIIEKLYYQGNLLSYRLVSSENASEWVNFSGNATISANYANGKLAYEETYKNGVLDGIKKVSYDNGKTCWEYRYANGGYHGEYKTYYSNGNVMEKGSYDRGERQGVREKYNEDGSLSWRENYVMGSRHGKAELYVKGSKATEFKFNGGMTYE
jgi:antitoxin component YwqK of YwqJK toxin-antitoxin module/Flp pilus assembly protein TadD